MHGAMKATYQLRVWPEDEWWLARVVAASDGANDAPLNAITQARNLARIDSMGRDLIATILDADETEFDVEFEYSLPDGLAGKVRDAKGARNWLDAVRYFWHDRSTLAARALADAGFSLRETATLMGLSYQRVDQLLGDYAARDDGTVVFVASSSRVGDAEVQPSGGGGTPDVDAFLVVRPPAAHRSQLGSTWPREGLEARFQERIAALITEVALDAAS
jgi:hypothetical protein